MRELKFRAFNTIDKVMIEDLNAPHLYHGRLIHDIYDILMQFTGLKDRNGVYIYEGDIIKNQRGRTGQVVWHEYSAGFDSEFISDDGTWPNPSIDKAFGFQCSMWSSHVEVVGNIHQNKELLEC
jgi:uncharacterized phage protein (TIGR01671 family)